ncbi:hypothetical protein Tco_1514358 [Tanacetum coccineum]
MKDKLGRMRIRGQFLGTVKLRAGKRVKDSSYHKDKMLLLKGKKQGTTECKRTWLLIDLVENQKIKNWKHITSTWLRFRQHTEQPKSINDTYVVEKHDSNGTLVLSDMNNNEGEVDRNDEERDLLASLKI